MSLEQTKYVSPRNRYYFEKCIGKGNFGDVYRANNTSSGDIVAVKVVPLDDSSEEMKQILQEIQFLSKLRNQFITQYIESFVEGYNMFIVMEYCGGGSCSDLLKFHRQLDEGIVSYIIKGVLSGLSYLHSEHKVHRDIKSANILLTEDAMVKLADFGVSGEITMTKLKKNTFVGTPFWMAPEVIARSRIADESGYNEKADIWSTGITTIELVTGAPPLSQYDPLKVLFEIPKKRPPTLQGCSFSDNIKDFVKYCLVKDPLKRPSANKLLLHYFINRAQNVRERLINLINLKNFHMESKAKKPRHKLSPIDGHTYTLKNPISWKFETEKSFNPLKKVDYLSDEEEIQPLCPKKKPKVQLEEEHQQQKEDRAKEKEIEQSSGRRLSKDKACVLFLCLERVYQRGKNEFSKQAVEELVHTLQHYEQEIPGLCHTIVDEFEHLLGSVHK
ncbi:Sporulation-specific protein 1 [Spathaspora sp. JA1]|nr:Sporulation-specific protein 1 [Spathaspora sp. JA1]